MKAGKTSFGMDEYASLAPDERRRVDQWIDDEGLLNRFVFQVDVETEGSVLLRTFATRDGKPYAVDDDVARAAPFVHKYATPPPFPARFWR
jgi:hypothetical protein